MNNKMEIIQFYSNPDPIVEELVLVQFTEMKVGFFDGILMEYPGYTGIMNFKDATKSRWVNSWSKVVPLHRMMVATVDSIDTDKKTVQLSIVYLNTSEEENVQEKLLKPFKENKTLLSFIKTVCRVNCFEFNTIWTKLIHHIDILRKEENDDKESSNDSSLYTYFCDNIDMLDNWIDTVGLDKNVYNAIISLYEKRTMKAPHKITSSIGIISPNGILHTKKLLEKVLHNISSKQSFNYNMMYEATPNYNFTTSSEDSTEDDHKKFVKTLEIESQKCDPKVFIKVNSIAKEII
jgi:translation initiation factor 2 alpha subunit (eIF-2alpha)